MPDQDSEAAADVTDVTQQQQEQRSATPPTPKGRPHSTTTPRTPQTQVQTHQDAPSPLTSPLLPSSMSLYQLGIASLSPLRRQFSSPLSGHSLSPPSTSAGGQEADIDEEVDDADVDGGSDGGSRSEATDELTQDSRDVLVERLTDLVQRLSRGDTSVLQDANISALHAKVDEMETVLAAGGRPAMAKRRSREPRSRPTSGIYVGGGDGAVDEQDPFGIMSPSWVMSHFYGADSTHTSILGGEKDRETGREDRTTAPAPAPVAIRPEPGPRKISADVAERIIQEAENLCAEMSEVVKSLQDRREESDHLHHLFIEREERAAERILELEGRVEELEDEVQEAESDLRYLRLQLKAIEVQCLDYIPPDADPELVQSIQNWKTDWANLKKRWASRRSTSFEGESIASVSSPPAR